MASRSRLSLRPPPRRFREQWASLRHAIDALECDIDNSPHPKPTERLCKLLIVAEDRRFAWHPGVDPFALCRAFWQSYFRRSLQGGSTIAMQLVRTLTGRRERTWRRKFAEICLALRLPTLSPKARWPVLYLWAAYYGWNMEGFSRASSRAGFDPTTSTLDEDAQLIARLKYPQPRHADPIHTKKIRARARYIVARAERRNISTTTSIQGVKPCTPSR